MRSSPVEAGLCGRVAWQEKKKRNGTTPLLVVGFAGTCPPGWLDHSTWPVGGPSGRSAGTDRVPAQLGSGLPAVEACRRNVGPAVLGRAVSMERPCRAGSVGSLRSGWVGLPAAVVCPSSGRTQTMGHSANGMNGFRGALSRVEAFDWNESMSRPVRGSTGGWRCLGASRVNRAGPKSRHRKTSNPAGSTCASGRPVDLVEERGRSGSGATHGGSVVLPP